MADLYTSLLLDNQKGEDDHHTCKVVLHSD
jgi:hypothetical protein